MAFTPTTRLREYCGPDCQDAATGAGPRPGDPTPEEIEAACKILREKRTRETIGLESLRTCKRA